MVKEPRKRGMPIVVNLSLLVSAGVLISALLAIWIYGMRSDSLYNAEVRNNLVMLADTVSPQVVGALAIRDAAAVNAIMTDSVGANEQVADAMIVLKETGEVFYDLEGPREGRKFTDKLKKPGVVYISRPIILRTGLGYGLKVSEEKLGSLVMGVQRKDFLRNERVRAVVSFARSMSQNIAGSVAAGDFLQVRDIMGNMVGSSRNIVYAQLLHTDGTILFYTEIGKSEEKTRALEGEKETSAAGRRAMRVSLRKPLLMQNIAGSDGEPILDIAVPVLRKGEKIGVVRIGYSMADFLAAQARSRILIIAMSSLFALVGLAFAFFTALRISQPIRVLASAAQRLGAGDMDQKVFIKTGGRETRELGASFNQMIDGLKERDFVKDTFGKYMSKQVADEILKNPDAIALGGKKQEVTIMFSDIRGFTPFAEGRPPEEVISHLNEYMSAMVDVVIKYEGIVDKFIGDAIMALYGSPISREDDALRAMRAALEMKQRLIALNRKWKDEGKEPFRIGIGINTGEVIVGNIGDIRKMEYTVIGDNVNVASRLEGLTKNLPGLSEDSTCRIIISRSAYEKVMDFVIVNQLDAVTVKGKSQAVEIYELLGIK
ncbi:MAG: adenylate/guanylate cyclase domain-containing protein [bacterium]